MHMYCLQEMEVIIFIKESVKDILNRFYGIPVYGLHIINDYKESIEEYELKIFNRILQTTYPDDITVYP